MNQSANVKSDRTDALLEALAEIEHRQWMHWSKAIAAEVPSKLQDQWRRCWIEYDQLDEPTKESDRVWAREVIALLREQKLIP